MGRTSEYISYLKIPPLKLTDFKKELFYISITEEMKAKRKELRLYNDDKIIPE